jgi:hypothetical protein
MIKCTRLGHMETIKWLLLGIIETKYSTHFAHKFKYISYLFSFFFL